MRNAYLRSVREALAIFLEKVRLGFSNRVLVCLFRLTSKRSVSHICHQVRVALMQDFVPNHVGFQQYRERPFLLNIKQRWLQNFLPMVQTKLLLLQMERTFSVKSRPIASSNGAHIVSTNADIL